MGTISLYSLIRLLYLYFQPSQKKFQIFEKSFIPFFFGRIEFILNNLSIFHSKSIFYFLKMWTLFFHKIYPMLFIWFMEAIYDFILIRSIKSTCNFCKVSSPPWLLHWILLNIYWKFEIALTIMVYLFFYFQ